MADTQPSCRIEGKLIELSGDGRVVSFEAWIEVKGELFGLVDLSEEEAEAIRPLVGERVVVTIAGAAALQPTTPTGE